MESMTTNTNLSIASYFRLHAILYAFFENENCYNKYWHSWNAMQIHSLNHNSKIPFLESWLLRFVDILTWTWYKTVVPRFVFARALDSLWTLIFVWPNFLLKKNKNIKIRRWENWDLFHICCLIFLSRCRLKKLGWGLKINIFRLSRTGFTLWSILRDR